MIRISRNLNDQQAKSISQLNMAGVYLLKDSKRYYPNEEFLSHVLGFTGIDNQGLCGIELIYDNLLTSQKGSLNYYMDAHSHLLPLYPSVYEQPSPGYDLILTVSV